MSLPNAAVVSGTVISSSVYNGNNTDIVNALTASIANDGQTPILADLPMSTYKHTGVGNATARTNYAAAGQVQDSAFLWCGTAGGTADALTLTPSPAITAYAAGQVFRFIAGASPNTGATTVAVSGLTAKAVQSGGSALTAAQIKASTLYTVEYDGTAFQLISNGVATAAQVTTGTDDVLKITPLKLTTVQPASATADTSNDKMLILDASDSNKLKQAAFPAAGGLTLIAPSATTSGTQVTITGIPSTAKQVILSIDRVSTNGTSPICVRLGTSGGIDTSAYRGGTMQVLGSTASANDGGNFIYLMGAADAGERYSGAVIFTLLEAATNTWSFVVGIATDGATTQFGSAGGGVKALSAALDRVQITTAGGANTFDAGQIAVAYQ